MENISKKTNKSVFISIMLLYLLGIFMGAIDTGIITPARTVIQGNLGVDDKTGIWMINIFTLAYAASIPISGKLADRIGRKPVYIVTIFLFGLGSLICGISQSFGSFQLLLLGRVIQAIGGGGIMPVANAEFGTSFPPEKRGMALGLIGGVYGIANILGSSAGSAILNITGVNNWQWLFYINIPISIVIIIGGIFLLPASHKGETRKIDIIGTTILVAMILSLLYGLKGINYFNFFDTIKDTAVYPYILTFLFLLPVFVLIEKRAQDPVLNLSYFTDGRIIITLILSWFVGVTMMGMIFVPQFSENALKIPTGSGGYFVTILGFFAGFGAPLSGKLVDRFGPKKVLLGGFLITTSGALFLSFIATAYLNLPSVIISLLLIGVGMGFTMGTPLNYMMLANTRKEEANSALATISLVRSIGTTIGPAIMIGFIAQAGLSTQDELMKVIPTPAAPRFSKVDELKPLIEKLKADPKMAENLSNIDLEKFESSNSMNFDMNGSGELPKEILESFKTADVTNITDRTKNFTQWIFDDKIPPVISEIQNGVQNGIDGMSQGIEGMDKAVSDMNKGAEGISKGIDRMQNMLSMISSFKQSMPPEINKPSMVQMKGSGKMPDGLKNMSGYGTAPLQSKTTETGWPAPETENTIEQASQPDIEKDENPGVNSQDTTEIPVSTKDELLNPKDQSGFSGLAASTTPAPSPAVSGFISSTPALSEASDSLQIEPTVFTSGNNTETATNNTSGSITGIGLESDNETDLNSTPDPLHETNSEEIQNSDSESATSNKTHNESGPESNVPSNSPENISASFSGSKPVNIPDGKPLNMPRGIPEMMPEGISANPEDIEKQLEKMTAERQSILDAIGKINEQKTTLNKAIEKMKEIKSDVPIVFDVAKNDYLSQIENLRPKLENTFQATINKGFHQMYLTVAILSFTAMIILLFYFEKKKIPDDL